MIVPLPPSFSPHTPEKQSRSETDLFEAEIARRTADGWLIVSRTPEAVQFRKPKKVSGIGFLLLCIVLPVILIIQRQIELALLASVAGLLVIGVIYIATKEQLEYVSASSFRQQ